MNIQRIIERIEALRTPDGVPSTYNRGLNHAISIIREEAAREVGEDLPRHASTGLDSFVTRLEKMLHSARPTELVSVSQKDLHELLFHFIRLDNAAREKPNT